MDSQEGGAEERESKGGGKQEPVSEKTAATRPKDSESKSQQQEERSKEGRQKAENKENDEGGTGGATEEEAGETGEGEREEAKGRWWSPSRNTGIKYRGRKLKNRYHDTRESLRKIAIGVQKRGSIAKRKTVSTWAAIGTFRQHAMALRAKERSEAATQAGSREQKRRAGGAKGEGDRENGKEVEEGEGRAEERASVCAALWVLLRHEVAKDHRKLVNRLKKEGSDVKEGFRQQKRNNIVRARRWRNYLQNKWQKLKRLRYLRIQWRRPPPSPPEEGKGEGQLPSPEATQAKPPPPQQPPEKEGKGKDKVREEGKEEQRDKGKQREEEGEGAAPKGEREGGEGAEASEERADMFFKNAPIEEVLEELEATEDGLTDDQVQERLKKYGENALSEHRPNPIVVFLLFYWNPLAWTMEIACVHSRSYICCLPLSSLPPLPPPFLFASPPPVSLLPSLPPSQRRSLNTFIIFYPEL